ncbi:PREDICTED: uncharacterized protein LOC104782751 isoform X2 [Camelina sativa]|uniref:Uncharacterized protein LOC104782751 isoform X2 n=1 Tax=Camelina sativa TaxID=90675 RepID=A0ABM0YUH9_CAMSA|nr:PREDICTED: uncharacterized protein LOC104782751 isoform X2 [Camelina sativa]
MAGQYVSNDVKTSLGPVGLDRMLTNDILGDIDAATVLRMLRRWGVKEPATNVFDITRNPVTACQAASNDVKTSLGPVGLDPMLTNDILGDIDAATVLRMLRRWGVKEPATNVFDITRNPVTACQAASNDVKTSLGPVGLDPMLTNDILGDIDAATVLRMLRRWGVKEPATNVFDITRNPVTACQAASNDVKTSLGPVGLDPMLTNDILGDIDAATVLRMLRRWGVKEPATNVFDITRNPVTACQAASKNIKTSLGPVGLDRMLMDDIGEMTITTDAATILRMFRRWGVKHPATKTRGRMRGKVSI